MTCSGFRKGRATERDSFAAARRTRAGRISQSSHPILAFCARRVQNRAATTAMQTGGHIAPAVYSHPGVIRKFALFVILALGKRELKKHR